MAFRLQLRFASPDQLQAHLVRYAGRGGVVVPERLCPELPVPGPPDGVELEFVVGERRAIARGQAVRRERQGVVVELSREALRDAFLLSGKGHRVALGRLGGRRMEVMEIRERVRPMSPVDAQDLPRAAITPVGEVLLEWDQGQQTQAYSSEEGFEVDLSDVLEEQAESGWTPPVPQPTESDREASSRTMLSEPPSAQTDPDLSLPSMEEREAIRPPLPPGERVGVRGPDRHDPHPTTRLSSMGVPEQSVPEGRGEPDFDATALPADLTARDLLVLACDDELSHQHELLLQIVHHPAAPRALSLKLLGRLRRIE